MNQAMGWNFDNSYVRLPETFYTRQRPTSVEEPGLVFLNASLANSLGLQVEALMDGDGTAVFGGNEIPEGAIPLAQAYAGHQFGNFTMLGDGRAVLLGEQITPKGERVDIQLKGAGRTSYSRGGDGRAALGPMLREYLISEAMHALGIPTTRSLAVVVTGEPVYRETPLPGAILTRVASSHLRVGTFEYAAHLQGEEELRALADYALERHYPELRQEKQPYLSLLRAVMERQARLIAKWQLIGFIHGVMNTDNMTISGETIDYGPCAFMDTYDPATVFSSIDQQGRYAYGNQPYMAGWNVARFAESLLPLLHENQEMAIEIAQQEMPHFTKIYEQQWLQGMREKLGLFNEEPEDAELVERLLKWMEEQQADFTNTFRALTLDQIDKITGCKDPKFTKWFEQWKTRREKQTKSEEDSRALMKKSNPSIIPRNHLVEEALDAAVEERDLHVMEELLQALADPYAYTPEQEKYTTLPKPSKIPYQTFCGT
ncbi:protein adenylyltransferase SelO [Bacillus sp. SD088]|uniref:protein adenylyltransferase SelO n=1 Tax=Bacillus sp. SD088 TaxID=2782012 RepID=UPI001A96F83A|nr:YdiU family protein [Bacillus sp. SD088]MBO0995165.1 YdiU family protein [Bacillus sp. SD088]